MFRITFQPGKWSEDDYRLDWQKDEAEGSGGKTACVNAKAGDSERLLDTLCIVRCLVDRQVRFSSVVI
jgi:hypothetical protein